MGIPDYVICHTIGEELKYRRTNDRLRDDLPAPRSGRSDNCDRVTAVRCLLSVLLRALADRIAPPQAIGSR